ncbi:MAG TPA: hypothetical protein VFX86_02740 [Candidatus Saccharimonadales bacterium]|nr:hypothetical protein [Candidatus Saccharimonadales bacterium]
MSIERPGSLIEVPAYQEQLLDATKSDGAAALGELAARTFDPESGEIAGHLALVSKEVEEILDEVYGRVHGDLRLTEQMVEDFAAMEGLSRVFDNAHAQPSLYRAVESIELSDLITGRGAEELALRSGLNRVVLDTMFAAPSLYRGVEELDHATRGAQPGMRAGFDIRVFREAMQQRSLYRGQETIESYASAAAEPAMRRSHDRRVRSVALGTSNLYRAVETIDDYSSEGMDEHMRTELNEKVRAEALRSKSVYRALETVRDYGFGDGREDMEREVAGKWLPEEQQRLAASSERVEEIEEKIKEFDELPFLSRFFRVNTRTSLRKDLRDTQAVVDMYQRSVDELEQILSTEE